MKVVLLGQYPPLYEEISGGVETCIIGLEHELKNYPDVELHIISSNILKKDVTKVVDNVTIHYIASPPLPRFIAVNTIDKYKVIKKLKELKPDIVHAHSTVQGYYSLISGFPNFITVHGIAKDEYDPRIQSGLLGIIRRNTIVPMENYVFKHAKVLTVLGHQTETKIESYYNYRGQIYIIPNGIDKEWFNNPNKEVAGRILFVGGIMPRKRIEYILQAVKIMKHFKKDIELHIVGSIKDKFYFNSLNKFIRENKLLKNIEFMGVLNDDDLKNEYSECSIFVLPSEEEQYPMVLLEAMASGKPVIASNVGNVSEMIKGYNNGFLFEYGDINGLVNKINTLLDDGELRNKFGKNGKKFAGKLDWNEVTKKYYNLYKNIIENGIEK